MFGYMYCFIGGKAANLSPQGCGPGYISYTILDSHSEYEAIGRSHVPLYLPQLIDVLVK